MVGYSPWGCQELDTTERLHFGFLKKYFCPERDYEVFGVFSRIFYEENTVGLVKMFILVFP